MNRMRGPHGVAGIERTLAAELVSLDARFLGDVMIRRTHVQDRKAVAQRDSNCRTA